MEKIICKLVPDFAVANAILFLSVLILSRKAKNFLSLFSELFVPNGLLFFISPLNQIILLPIKLHLIPW